MGERADPLHLPIERLTNRVGGRGVECAERKDFDRDVPFDDRIESFVDVAIPCRRQALQDAVPANRGGQVCGRSCGATAKF